MFSQVEKDERNRIQEKETEFNLRWCAAQPKLLIMDRLYLTIADSYTFGEHSWNRLLKIF